MREPSMANVVKSNTAEFHQGRGFHTSSTVNLPIRPRRGNETVPPEGIVPNCSPAGWTLCAAKRRKIGASGGGNAWERADSCPVLDRSLQNLQKLLVRKFHRIALHAAGPLGGGNDAGAFGHGQSGDLQRRNLQLGAQGSDPLDPIASLGRRVAGQD